MNGRPLRPTLADVGYLPLQSGERAQALFDDDGHYAAFERVLGQACARVSMRLLACCVMPNHWHLVVWPRQDGALSRFMNWLTLTHTQRWHQHRHSVGDGHHVRRILVGCNSVSVLHRIVCYGNGLGRRKWRNTLSLFRPTYGLRC